MHLILLPAVFITIAIKLTQSFETRQDIKPIIRCLGDNCDKLNVDFYAFGTNFELRLTKNSYLFGANYIPRHDNCHYLADSTYVSVWMSHANH